MELLTDEMYLYGIMIYTIMVLMVKTKAVQADHSASVSLQQP